MPRQNRKIEKGLKLTKEYLRSFLHVFPDPMVLVDESCRILWMNDRMTQIAGHGALGKKCYKVYRDDGTQCAACPLKKPIRIGGTKTLLVSGVFGGRSFKVSHIGVMHEGKKAALELLKDVTDLVHARESIQRKDELLQQVGAMAKVGGWEYDVSTGKQLWTDETYRIHDVSKGTYDPNAKNEISRFTPQSKPLIDRAFREAANHGKPYDLELEMVTVQGNHKFVRAIGSAEKANGKIKRIFGTVQDITERRKAQEDVRLKSTLLDSVTDSVLVYDQKGNLVYVNEAAYRDRGYRKVEMLKMNMRQVNTPENSKFVDSRIRKTIQGGKLIFETVHLRKDGSFMPVEAYASSVEWGGKKLVLSIAHDITERKEREQQLFRTNRALRVISECNQVLVREKDEQKLMDHICQLLVADGGYRMAWVGFAEQDKGKSVHPVSSYGFKKDYIENIHVTWANTPHGRGPTGTAIRTGKAQICRNLWTDPTFAPWRAKAIKLGYASSVALPLIFEEQAIGALNIYSEQPDAFDEGEMRLLNELAGDLAYGIMALRTKADLSKFKLGIERSDQVIFMTDRDGTIFYVNPMFEKVYGYTAKEALGKTPRLIKSGIPPKAFYKYFWDTILRKDVVRGDIVNKTKNGRLLTMSGSANPILDDKGEIVGFMAIQTDITTQRKIKEELDQTHATLEKRVIQRTTELSQEKAKTEALLGGLGESILAIDPQGKVIFMNGAAEDLFGKPASALVDRHWWKWLKFEDLEGVQITMGHRLLTQVRQKRKNIYTVLYFIFSDGHRIPLATTISPIFFEGQPLGLIVAFRDITKEQEIDHAKNEFVALASHQLRTPLTGTKWLIQAVLKRGGLNQWQKEFLGDALKSNDRMIQLVSDLLNISRLEAGVIGFFPQKTGAAHLLDDIIKEVETDNRVKDLRIIFRRPARETIAILDPNLTRQMIVNLLSNAVKYTPKGKAIILSVGQARGFLNISIKDQGIGISKKDQKKLFTKFFRSEKATRIDTKGSGLGLYILKKILDVCGGQIACQSKIGKGSIFTITLPLRGPKKKKGNKELITHKMS